MTDATNQPSFNIQKIYLKDLSFEAPSSPAAFNQQWAPEANMEMNTSYEKLDDVHYEVVLKMTITAKNKNDTAFLIEIKQAGIFAFQNIPEEQMDPLLMAYCPNALFPYARDVIATTVFRGSFPELNLSPVNFDALYWQSKQQNTTNQTVN
jgi:preprotein translocase subunit SecB